MANEWTDNIIRQWISEGIKLNPGATMDEITETEKFLNFILPDQFKQLYLKVNGFQNWDWRVNMFSLWPIDKIKQEFSESDDKNFIGFCDYLINSHQIGFYKTKQGIFKSYDEFNPVAVDFKEVIRLINSDTQQIY